jgi:hypothetical protein
MSIFDAQINEASFPTNFEELKKSSCNIEYQEILKFILLFETSKTKI